VVAVVEVAVVGVVLGVGVTAAACGCCCFVCVVERVFPLSKPRPSAPLPMLPTPLPPREQEEETAAPRSCSGCAGGFLLLQLLAGAVEEATARLLTALLPLPGTPPLRRTFRAAVAAAGAAGAAGEGRSGESLSMSCWCC
jgi:hypothetical protein